MTEEGVARRSNESFESFVTARLCPAIRQVVDASYRGNNAPVALYAAILMMYAEVLGHATLGTLGDHDKDKGAAEGGFRKIFGEMGDAYKAFRGTWDNRTGQSLYDAFRNGLVRQLSPKVPTTIHFKNNEGVILAPGRPDITIPKPVQCGIGAIADGYCFIVIEKYLDDFEATCYRLFRQWGSGHEIEPRQGEPGVGSDSDGASLRPDIRWIQPGTSSPDAS